MPYHDQSRTSYFFDQPYNSLTGSYKKFLISRDRADNWGQTYSTLKALNGLKDSECKKRQLSSRPPVLYVPPTDFVTTKEEMQSQKIKLPDSIYSHGNTEEYLAHIIAVLRIIKQKGLDVQCRKLGKAVAKLTGTFKDLLEAAGLNDTLSLDNDMEARKLEIKETQRCSKKPRSSMTRQLPRRTSN